MSQTRRTVFCMNKGHAWHHHEVVGIMELVENTVGTEAHRLQHNGGVLIWEILKGVTKYR